MSNARFWPVSASSLPSMVKSARGEATLSFAGAPLQHRANSRDPYMDSTSVVIRSIQYFHTCTHHGEIGIKQAEGQA